MAVHVFRNLFWKISYLFSQILITCLYCSRASFSPSSYSKKMHLERGCVQLTKLRKETEAIDEISYIISYYLPVIITYLLIMLTPYFTCI